MFRTDILRALAGACSALALASAPSHAAKTNVAVAANFTDAAKEIAVAFKRETGHEAVLSFGSSGQFYTQITREAPFQVFLSADEERPAKLIADGFAVTDTRFTYAVGRLALWSRSANFVTGAATLKAGAFRKIAIASPAAAPYGVAAIETMKSLGVYDALKARIVEGASIAQAFQFIESGNAELGFVAGSQVAGYEQGSRWLVDQAHHKPILQDAVLLKKGVANEAASAFVAFLKGPTAKSIITKFGYETR